MNHSPNVPMSGESFRPLWGTVLPPTAGRIPSGSTLGNHSRVRLRSLTRPWTTESAGSWSGPGSDAA